MKKKKTARPARRPAKRSRPKQVKARRPSSPARRQAAAPATAARTTSSSKGGAPNHIAAQGLYGWITHTDIASMDPVATREWCIKVLGWTFRPPFAMPNGDYHLFAYSDKGGGGVHPVNHGHQPTSIPYVHVADAFDAFDRAILAGAQQILAPSRVSEGVTIAVVRAPGGVTIGLSGP
jgi:predicted enzyme related to lactoylglutathione lyase